MALVTVYAVTLMVAVLVSDLTRRSVLSTSVLFLFVGLVLAAGRFTELAPSHVFVQHVAEVALVSTLFTDAMRMPLSELRSVWHLPGRALFVGLPLTLLLTALLTKMLTDLPWLQSLLVGAVLSPTDPVLAAAIVGSRRVPGRVKQLLNVESGLNDGLALPCVMLLLDRLQSHETSSYAIASQLAGGVVLGVVLTMAMVWTYRRRLFGAAMLYRPLFAFSLMMMAWSIATEAHANAFLATFAAGVTLATIAPKARDHFHPMGERLSELLKLAALLVFGALVPPEAFFQIGWKGWAIAVGVLLVARPAAILLALAWSPLDWRERLTAAWFGPRGFASVVFGILVADSGVPGAQQMFAVIAVTVALSIVAHASTDVLVSGWFPQSEDAAEPVE